MARVRSPSHGCIAKSGAVWWYQSAITTGRGWSSLAKLWAPARSHCLLEALAAFFRELAYPVGDALGSLVDGEVLDAPMLLDAGLDGFVLARGRHRGYFSGKSEESVNSGSFAARAALTSAASSVASGSLRRRARSK